MEAYTNDLYAWAIRKTSDAALAEDLVQDTFLAAAEGWEAFERKSEPKTWLFGILRNKIAGHYRDKAGQAVQLLPSDDVSTLFDSKGRWLEEEKPREWWTTGEERSAWADLLPPCLKALPPLMAQCMELTYLQGRKGKEVYETLNISAANYWQSMSRARLKLRRCLEKARLPIKTDYK